MSKKQKNQIVFKRHAFWFGFVRPFVTLFAKMKHYESRSFLKMKKGEQYLVLANHQSDLDGIFVMLSFSRPLNAVTTDSFLSQGFLSRFVKHSFGIIPKKKGAVDIKCNMDMIRCFKEGGSLLIFPEGNRTYAEFQFSFTEGFAKFVRFFKKPIVLFNNHGGTGVSPRFANKERKGEYYGEIKRILTYEEYKDMSDDELYNLIKENLRVYDSESGKLYKSDARAEYLERMLFVCPKCGEVQSLESHGNVCKCNKCGLEVEYTEDLHFVSQDPEFKFNKTIDWYNYQIRFVRDYVPTDKPIFIDENVELYISHPGVKRKLVEKGKLTLYKDKIIFGNTIIPISDIEIASPISGTKFNFSTVDEDYLVIGDERFNPLKYVLMFNKLETKMKINKADIYYTLEERK